MDWLPLAEVQGSCNVCRAGPWPPFPIPTSLGSSHIEGLCTHRVERTGSPGGSSSWLSLSSGSTYQSSHLSYSNPTEEHRWGRTGPWMTDSAGSHGDEVASKWIRCLGTSAREIRYSNALPSQGFHNSAFLSATLSNSTITKVTWIHIVSHI